MGSVSKRQQPDQRTGNNKKSHTGLQCIVKQKPTTAAG